MKLLFWWAALSLRRGFTLVEMLIVIVIIGILVAALVPRFAGSQSQARDTARQSNLSQISTALALYANDYGTFPNSVGWCVSAWSELSMYLTTIPRDPQANRVTPPCSQPGAYAYLPLKRWGIENSGMIIMSTVENHTKANLLWDGSITLGSDAEQVQQKLCVGKCPASWGSPYYVIIQ